MGNEVLNKEQIATRRFLIQQVDNAQQDCRLSSANNVKYFYAREALRKFYDELENGGIQVCRER
jgi:hypothetical protein